MFEQGKFDAVCNLAAQAGVRYSLINPQAYVDSNIVGFVNLLEACRQHKIKHLAYASSSSVYGLNKKVPFETTDNVDHPISLYAATKKSNELMAHMFKVFTNDENKKVKSYFAMLHTIPDPDLVAIASKKIYEGEDYYIVNDCIYFYCEKGYGKAKFNMNFFEQKLKTFATARNYNTMVKLIAMSSENN